MTFIWFVTLCSVTWILFFQCIRQENRSWSCHVHFYYDLWIKRENSKGKMFHFCKAIFSTFRLYPTLSWVRSEPRWKANLGRQFKIWIFNEIRWIERNYKTVRTLGKEKINGGEICKKARGTAATFSDGVSNPANRSNSMREKLFRYLAICLNVSEGNFLWESTHILSGEKESRLEETKLSRKVSGRRKEEKDWSFNVVWNFTRGIIEKTTNSF